MNNKRLRHFSGQSLIEITVALGALTVLLTVASIAIITAVGNAQESKNHNQASSYAQQGVEIVRQMRDSSWTSFNGLSGGYCMASTCNQITSAAGACGRRVTANCGANVGSLYSREVILSPGDVRCSVGAIAATRVQVIVAWADSKCTGGNTFCRNVTVETCFSNIYGNSGL